MKCLSMKSLSTAIALSVIAGGAWAQEAGEPSYEDLAQRVRSLEERLLDAEAVAALGAPGTTRFLWSGYAFTRYVDADGASSSFESVLAPVLLWRVDENLFFESELELELEFEDEGSSHVGVEYMNAGRFLNDHISVGGGQFLTPFGIFSERVHPAWINKLPDAPLTVGHTGIVPFTSVGLWARGGVDAGSTSWNYSLYVSNGPRLNTGEDEPEEAGLLHFDNYVDVNNGRAVGGRVGFLPVPEVEFGASVLTASVAPTGNDVGKADATLVGVDFSLNHDVKPLGGRAEVRAEWDWSDVDDVTYDPTGALGFGPLTYDNQRDGGFVMASYRPVWSENELTDGIELVVRYDQVSRPSGAPVSFDESRCTVGLDYWINPSSVCKLAYRFDDRNEGMADQDAFLFQFVVGL